MEEDLANLWSGLTLTESEACTIKVDSDKLITPINALVGRLVVRKFASLYDLEKSLRSTWDVKTPLEITQIGDNLYIFELVDRKVCDQIFNRHPWTFRGSQVLPIDLEATKGRRTSISRRHLFGFKRMDCNFGP